MVSRGRRCWHLLYIPKQPLVVITHLWHTPFCRVTATLSVGFTSSVRDFPMYMDKQATNIVIPIHKLAKTAFVCILNMIFSSSLPNCFLPVETRSSSPLFPQLPFQLKHSSLTLATPPTLLSLPPAEIALGAHCVVDMQNNQTILEGL